MVPHRSRAFVMPMVLLALVVVSLGIGVSLSRFAAETRIIARQNRAYQEHHSGRGLQEAIGAWLRQQNGREIDEAIDPLTGHAMDIELVDGSVVSVFLQNGQGSLLADLSALPPDDVDLAGSILKSLSERVRPEEYLRLTRSVGPASVSIDAAPESVIRAVAEGIAGEGNGDTLADELLRVRARSGEVTRTEITRAIAEAGLDNPERVAALRMFATDVQLWAIIVELRGGRGLNNGRLLSRYGGLTRLRTTSRTRGVSNSNETGAFLSWQDLGIEDEEFDLDDLDDR